MKSVNERSSSILTLRFTDEDGQSVVPTSGQYRLMDETTEQILMPWTVFVPSTYSYDISIPQEINRIIDDTLISEVKIVSAVVQYAGNKQSTGEFKYEVINLVGIPPEFNLISLGGIVLGGVATFN